MGTRLLTVAALALSTAVSFASGNPAINATLPPNITQTLETPFPYDFPNLHNAETSALFPMPPCNGIILEESTIDQLQGYMSNGALTSVQLALCYLQRHWQTDDYIK